MPREAGTRDCAPHLKRAGSSQAAQGDRHRLWGGRLALWQRSAHLLLGHAVLGERVHAIGGDGLAHLQVLWVVQGGMLREQGWMTSCALAYPRPRLQQQGGGHRGAAVLQAHTLLRKTHLDTCHTGPHGRHYPGALCTEVWGGGRGVATATAEPALIRRGC